MEVTVTEMIPWAECVSTWEGLYKCNVQPLESNIINSDTSVGLHQLWFINTLILLPILLLFLLIAAYRLFVNKTNYISNKDSWKKIFKIIMWLLIISIVLFVIWLFFGQFWNLIAVWLYE